MRIHILGLPRSGTTALSEALARRLDLPLLNEPIFLWTDGFCVDLELANSLTTFQRIRIKDKFSALGKLRRLQGGFIEKTPSSIFFAPWLSEILTDSIFIMIERDYCDIIRSLELKVLAGRDPNVSKFSSLRLHNVKIRFIKTVNLFEIRGVVEGILGLVRYFSWARRNSITALADRAAIRYFVRAARDQQLRLNIGSRNKLLVISYDRFRNEPDVVIDEVAEFCIRANDGANFLESNPIKKE